MERQDSKVQDAVDKGLPKTKLTGMPFRMEMSGFARLHGSIPITGDIGVVWPVVADEVAEALGIELEFNSAPQECPDGQRMREWIANEIRFVDREAMFDQARALLQSQSVTQPVGGRGAEVAR